MNMNPPRVYTCSPSWTPLPPPSPYHPSGSSQCTMEIRLLCPKVYPEKNSEIHFCVTPERTECQIELVTSFTTKNWPSQVKAISGESPKRQIQTLLRLMKSLALVLRTQLDLVFLFFHRDLSFYAFPLLCSYFNNLLEFPAALFPIVILSKT